jgi:hypothetical protein
MIKFKKSQKSGNLGNRLDSTTDLFNQIQREIENLRAEVEIALKGCWIVRYQARGTGGLIGTINGNHMTRFS